MESVKRITLLINLLNDARPKFATCNWLYVDSLTGQIEGHVANMHMKTCRPNKC